VSKQQHEKVGGWMNLIRLGDDCFWGKHAKNPWVFICETGELLRYEKENFPKRCESAN
jgi:hypothetical protein